MRRWPWVLVAASVLAAPCLTGCGAEPECGVAPREVEVEHVPEDLDAVVDVSGIWSWNRYVYAGGGDHGTWTLTQEGDDLGGTFRSVCNNEEGDLRSGFLQGNKIVINDGRVRYMGTVGPSTMKGTWVAANDPTATPQDWDAVRESGSAPEAASESDSAY